MEAARAVRVTVYIYMGIYIGIGIHMYMYRYEAPADARGAESQPLQALVRLVGGHGGRASSGVAGI